MARPMKKGLDYFSLDVSFYRDIKLRKLVRRKGGSALTVYTILLCIIYENGYYLEWDDDLPFVISEATDFEEDKITDIINYCIEVGLFDQELYKNEHVLTSHGIQERYKSACSMTKRKLSPNLPYQLVSFSQNTVNSKKTEIMGEQSLVFSEETDINSEEIKDNSELSTQIKEKEIKEDIDSSLRSESPSSATTGKDDEVNLLAFQDFFNRTMQEHGAQIPTITQIGGQRRQRLLARVKEYGKDALRKAIINAATAPFLNGAGEKVFVASLDWILRPNNFPKVLEGNYNHVVSNPNLNNHGTGNNNGYRTAEDMRQGAVRIINGLSAAAQQPKTELPVV